MLSVKEAQFIDKRNHVPVSQQCDKTIRAIPCKKNASISLSESSFRDENKLVNQMLF